MIEMEIVNPNCERLHTYSFQLEELKQQFTQAENPVIIHTPPGMMKSHVTFPSVKAKWMVSISRNVGSVAATLRSVIFFYISVSYLVSNEVITFYTCSRDVLQPGFAV